MEIDNEEKEKTPQMMDFSGRVRINISGLYYETMEATLDRFPKTLLGSPIKRREYYNEELREYYFSRHRTAFEAILYYYQSHGRLMRPEEIPMHVFVEELEFFQFEDEAIRLVRDPNGIFPGATQKELPKNKCQNAMWNLLENSDSSKLAFVVSLWSIFAIVVSVIIACVETTPPLKCESIPCNEGNLSCEKICRDKTPHVVAIRTVMRYLEYICYTWFITEYLLRLTASANKLEFIRAPLNLIDLLAIVPSVTFFIGDKSTVVLTVLRIARLFRVFRVFKLSRYSSGMKVLAYTIRASRGELSVMIIAMFMIVVLSSSAMYYLESQSTDSAFTSIPASFWWAIITICTVGYGDMWPHTGYGKVVGAVVSVLGVLTISLPLVAFSTNFEHYLTLFYQPETVEEKYEVQEIVVELEEESSNAFSSEQESEIRREDRDEEDPDIINERLVRAACILEHAKVEQEKLNVTGRI